MLLFSSHFYLLYHVSSKLLSTILFDQNFFHIQLNDNFTILAESQFLSHLKPISRLMFRLYTLTFFGDYLCMLLFLLLFGQTLLRLLIYSPNRIDNHNWTNKQTLTCLFTIAALIGHNLNLWFIYNIIVMNWWWTPRQNGRLFTLTEMFTLLRVTNHYLIPYCLWFYGYFTNLAHIKHIIQSVVKAQDLSTLFNPPISKPIIRLCRNLDQLNTYISPMLLSKLIFNLVNTIFTFLYLFLKPGFTLYHQRLFLIDLIFSSVIDLTLFYLATVIASNLDQLTEIFTEKVINLMVIDARSKIRTANLSKQQNNEIKLLNQIKQHLRLIRQKCHQFETLPRLFYLTHINLRIYLKMLLFATNMAIILFQTEQM